MIKFKIVIIGPLKAGKTTIANFLSENIDIGNDQYYPTEGVRILEFETKTRNFKVDIELWDCSGNLKYDSVWPVFLWNAHGIIIVYDPEDNEQLTELGTFFEYFVGTKGVAQNNCLIIGHYKDPDSKKSLPILSGPMSHVVQIGSNVLENGEELKQHFDRFVSSLLTEAEDYDIDNFSMLNMPI